MTYRVKVSGSSTRQHAFGVDMLLVASPADVKDQDGVLVITTLPYPGRPAQAPVPGGSSGYPARKATGPSVVAYPRGGWDKVTITQILEED